jgi:glycerol-3-phosphate O-acyltransferase
VLSLSEEEAVLMTYYRNNVLHIFALPSLVACCFLNNRALSLNKLVELCGLVYPFLRSELFLPWPEEDLGQVRAATWWM